MNISKVGLFFLIVAVHFGCMNALTEKKTVKISVIIPANYKHAKHLNGLLHILEQQTVLPDEVVISLSESGKVEPEIIEALRNTPWAFPCKLITSPSVQYAGKNRNIGCKNASGDVFILQDADDIPHPQRVEAIKYCFENYKDLNHLMHEYFFTNETQAINFNPINDMQKLPLLWNQSFSAIHKHGRFTNGNVAISRKTFEKVKWSDTMARGQDTDFNNRVYRSLKKTALLRVPLLSYRMYLSSLKKMKQYILEDQTRVC